MGPCIAGGAYLPALSDVIIMVEKVSFMGLGGPNLVKGAVGQMVDAESLGGAAMHTETSGVAHYKRAGRSRVSGDDSPAIPADARAAAPPARATPPAKSAEGLYDLCPPIIACLIDMEDVIARILDAGEYLEFQPEYAPEMLCATRASEWPADRRDRQPARISQDAGGPRIGGIVYPESARKVAYFVENAERQRLPLLYVQDVRASWWA